jgi:HSP20 family protein
MDEYLAIVDLPGVKSEDVTIEVNDQVLTLSGARVPMETGDAQLLERSFGAFSRTLKLPKGVDANSIAADYTDGVLTLRIPKPPHQKPTKIPIGGSHKTINN